MHWVCTWHTHRFLFGPATAIVHNQLELMQTRADSAWLSIIYKNSALSNISPPLHGCSPQFVVLMLCRHVSNSGPVHANVDICLSIKKVNPFKISEYRESTIGMPGQQMVLQSTSHMTQIPEKSIRSEPLADAGLGYFYIFHGKFTKAKTYTLLSH